MKNLSTIRIALAQLAPVWLNKEKTLKKVINSLDEAAGKDANLVVFGEALLPGYPFWPALTNGAEFDSQVQKELHAHYINNAIQIEKGDLESVCQCAKKHSMAVYLGSIERAANREGHSLYCSLVYINQLGEIKSVHRKLQPTYEERLTWSPGDGNGIQVHSLNGFTVGGLNCWENWMPLPRAALYGMGENLHIAVWPGSDHNTRDITRFIARESRSFVVSVSALMKKTDFPADTPHLNKILENCPDRLTNGGSCIAGPDGNWILEPVLHEEGTFVKELHLQRVFEERQNFDPSGHYSRPDVTQLTLNRKRQQILIVNDSDQ